MSNSRHGMSKTRLYHIWAQMIQRCHNPTDAGYAKYGAKGIQVYPDWHEPFIFMGWALLNGYKENLTIERLDVTKGYEPSNCTWILSKDQAFNKAKPKTNTSGYVGVSFHKETGKWVARVTINGTRKQLGRFNTALQAHEARKQYFIDNNLQEHLELYERQHK